MLLEQYMTPVNIIIAVILVVLGYLAYKKYQKNNNSYEHANTVSAPSASNSFLPIGIPNHYTFSEGYKISDNIESETNFIIGKFNKETLNFKNFRDKTYNFKINLNYNYICKEFRISGSPITNSITPTPKYLKNIKASISFTHINIDGIYKILINKTLELNNTRQNKEIDITTEINNILLKIGRGKVNFDINNNKSYLSIIPKIPKPSQTDYKIPYFVIDDISITDKSIEVQLYKNTMHTTTDQLQDTIRPYCSTCAICPQESKQE
jgi:hypothetical protein